MNLIIHSEQLLQDTIAMNSESVAELKWNKTAQAAIAQIKDRNYPEILKGLAAEILLVGINYDEKTKKHSCVIEKTMI